MGRGRPADLGQDPGSVGLGCRLDQTSGDHLLKSPVTPDRLTQPQTGIGCLDGLDQPGRPARDDLRPSHRTTVTRPLTTHLVSVIVEYRPQVQDLLTSQEPLAPQTHQRSQLSLVMGRPQVLHDPVHTMVLGHDLHGRGPRGCLDLTQVRTHPPDPTAALVPRNDHPTPTIPTKNPTLKHKPPQPVQLRGTAPVLDNVNRLSAGAGGAVKRGAGAALKLRGSSLAVTSDPLRHPWRGRYRLRRLHGR